jgi:hypothetical protein
LVEGVAGLADRDTDGLNLFPIFLEARDARRILFVIFLELAPTSKVVANADFDDE